NFTMEHDDGQLPLDIEEADVILIGISRTSMSPTCIYLANRGIKTANVPIVPGVPIADVIINAERPLIVGLIASAERISQVRQHRNLGAT
ncbi:kinase/pyrophosphorylase, partial [Escherichia coli]|uniref:kinase/pyrophosphorylase n=1 Tax=Escherichia coli TaxID=562 RepID=UPI0013D62569